MMQFFNSLGTSVDIDIRYDGEEQRDWVTEGEMKFPLYLENDNVSGKVSVRVKEGKSLEHQGLVLQFLGAIILLNERETTEFLSVAQELVPPGELMGLNVYSFEFNNIQKMYESYLGTSVKLRYVVRATIKKRANVTKEREIWVRTKQKLEIIQEPETFGVGIGDSLHLDFSFNMTMYSLSDVVVGSIKFKTVRLKVQYIELSIIRREITVNQSESEHVARFQIMDGAASKDDEIPIRMFLDGYKLTPSYKDVNKKFSVRYFLNLTLVDEEDRRYFKQQEITLYRELEDPSFFDE